MTLLRFAPSPTGQLHLGGLRMALYNHLFARKTGGRWMMRVEDTDATRFVPGSVEGIRKALDWAGLEYDYGPGREGPHGPYYQVTFKSERLDLYKTYADRLLESGHAYRCFCSLDKMSDIRERLARTGSNLTYDKTCLHLTEEEVVRKVKAGEKSVVRLNDMNLPERPPAFDLVFGHLKDAHMSLATDPILLKTDLFPTYHLASVVDDHEMGITHVLRGEEWLLSFPLHLDLYAALRLVPPKFAHIPILLNPDGSKMSKRKGDVQVIDYMKRGWEPEAVLNWLALAGWGAKHDNSPPDGAIPSSSSSHPPKPKQVQEAPDSTTLMSLSEMIEQFDLSALTHRSSSLDPAKLEYLNKNHLINKWASPGGLTALAERAHESLKAAFPKSQYTNLDFIKRVILTLEGRLTNIQDIPLHAPFFFEDPDLSSADAVNMIKRVPQASRDKVRSEILQLLTAESDSWETLDLNQKLNSEQDRLQIPYKDFMTTLRHDLCGRKIGPAVADVMRVLGKERTLDRLRRAQIA